MSVGFVYHDPYRLHPDAFVMGIVNGVNNAPDNGLRW